MRIPYLALPEPSQISNADSQISNEGQDKPYSTAAALVVAMHIRSFYRLFGIIAVLLVFISVGIAAIIMAYIGMHSCSASYNLSRTLNIFGTLDIIICVIIALIVIALMTCCYHRSRCLFTLLYFFAFISVWILILIVTLMPTMGRSNPPSTEYPTTTPIGAKNCEIVVKNTLWVIQNVLLLLFFLICAYSVVTNCKQRCQRKVHSTSITTTTV